jgi:hypothetical protein
MSTELLDDLLARLHVQLAKPNQEPLFGLEPGPDRLDVLREAVERMELTAENDEHIHDVRAAYAELLNRGMSKDLAKLLTLNTLMAEKGAQIDGLEQEVMQASFALIPPARPHPPSEDFNILYSIWPFKPDEQ